MAERPISKKKYLRVREVLKECVEPSPEMQEILKGKPLPDELFMKNYATYALDQQCLNTQFVGYETY